MVHLNETMHGVALASAVKGRASSSGACEVDGLLANVCKLNVTRLPFEIARLAEDIAGGLLVTMPSLDDRQHPEVGEYVRKYFAGKGDAASALRMRLVRLIENITLGNAARSICELRALRSYRGWTCAIALAQSSCTGAPTRQVTAACKHITNAEFF
jgi:aromatic ring hydroxylase